MPITNKNQYNSTTTYFTIVNVSGLQLTTIVTCDMLKKFNNYVTLHYIQINCTIL